MANCFFDRLSATLQQFESDALRGHLLRVHLSRAVLTVLLVGMLSAVVPSIAVGAGTLLKPGTSHQVVSAVASAASLTKLPKATLAELPTAASDSFVSMSLRSTCLVALACTYGTSSSKKTAVVFGDSHAVMWMPAVLPRLLSNGYRVTLVWFGACPAAQVDVYLPTYEYPATCNAVRTAEISSIINVHPSLVLLAERDHLVPSGPGTFYTPTTWTSALETTIRTLKGAGSKVGVIEDGPSFPWSVPTCLSQSPSMAKACGVQVGSGQASDMHAAEAGAAAHAGAFFIPTHQWLCATSCSAVIQSMVVYTDNDHLTKSYAGYLSGVMGSALGTFIH